MNDKTLLEANPAFYRILGIKSLEEVPAVLMSRVFAARDGTGYEDEPETPGIAEDLAVELPNGELRWFSLTISPARGKNNESIAEGLLEEITVRKAAEEGLKEADRRKDRFLAILSHELRNPLAALQSAIQLNQLTTSQSTEHWTHEILERQTKHLGRLIDDLLDVSRINQDKIDLQRENLDVSAIVRRAIDVVRPTFETNQHRLTVSVEPELYIHGDSTRIEQIVVNLLQNAGKYTPSGGEISVSATRENGSVVLTVSDNGVGIAPDVLPRIFEMFMQSDNSLDRSQGGLGIGLTLVKRLVELHEGEVVVTSDGMGLGTTFTVRLPAVTPIARAEEPQVAAPVHGSAAGMVLVVDDNKDSALLTAELLRLSGYHVITAHDGISALEIAERENPSIILLDIGLPGMDGCEVAIRLKKRPEFQNTLLVAISGYGQEHDLLRSKAAGFDHHLVKPVDFDILSGILQDGAVSSGSSANGRDLHSGV